MSTLNPDDIWQQILSLTQTSLPQAIWSTLIKEALMPLTVTEDSLQLAVLMSYKKDLIEKTPLVYNSLLQAAQSVLGPGVKLDIIDLNTNNDVSLETMTPASPTMPLPVDFSNAIDDQKDEVPEGMSRPVYDEPFVPEAYTPEPLEEYHNTLFDPHEVAPTAVKPAEHETPVNLSHSYLNPEFTFNTFIEGMPNLLAVNAAQSIADNFPKVKYNPLYIYGKSGLGKTHLMHAIGNRILELNPHAKVMAVTSENFLNAFVASIRAKTSDEFRNSFRNVDVLIIDDIQFLESKNLVSTTIEFFHTFNDLLAQGKQIILSSDIPANNLQLEDRLITRFNMGLSAEIIPPNTEMVMSIVENEILRERENIPHLHLSKEVVNFFGQTYNSRSVRDLKGAFNRLILAAQTENRIDSIDLEFTRRVITDLIPTGSKTNLSIPYIQKFIADYYSIKLELLLGKKKNKQYAFPRQVAMFLCREMINESYPQISQAFGKKDHTTALHAVDKIYREIEQNDDLKKTIEDIKTKIKASL